MGTVLRRLLATIPLLWGVCTLLFLGIHLLPGDASLYFLHPDLPAEDAAGVRESLGLDRGFAVQYGCWLRSAALLDFQRSLIYGRPVAELLREALPNTLLLASAALLLAFGGGIGAGLLAARRAGRLSDRLWTAGSVLVYSTPAFWLALMLLLVFAERLRLFPASGLASPDADFLPLLERPLDRLWHLALPAVSLAAGLAAAVFRFVRESLLEALAQDYCRTARAKGVPEALVLRRHALRNALLPAIQLLGLQLPLLFGGSVLIETVFGWPGMGRLLVRSILNQDYPVVLGGAFGLTICVVAGNLLADGLSALADPRIRREA
ncbi:MAG TPA: ABC transporter permease [Planctomycetota bacterium]|nr:ABC transporter permease [Planctomycetota bacterium]